jgi:hypothetical protein
MMMMMMMMIISPFGPTSAVGALFRDARYVHINRICINISINMASVSVYPTR